MFKIDHLPRFGKTRILTVDAEHKRGILTHGPNDNEAIVVGCGQPPEPGDLLTLREQRTAYIVERVRRLRQDKDFHRMWIASCAKWVRFGAGRLLR